MAKQLRFGEDARRRLKVGTDTLAQAVKTTLAPDGDTIRLYYGAADTSIALATGSVQAMLD